MFDHSSTSIICTNSSSTRWTNSFSCRSIAHRNSQYAFHVSPFFGMCHIHWKTLSSYSVDSLQTRITSHLTDLQRRKRSLHTINRWFQRQSKNTVCIRWKHFRNGWTTEQYDRWWEIQFWALRSLTRSGVSMSHYVLQRNVFEWSSPWKRQNSF